MNRYRITRPAAPTIATLLTLGVLFAHSPGSLAQSVIDQYNRAIQSSVQIQPLGSEIFGEEVNLLDGATTFRSDDIVVRANHSIPMIISRSLSMQRQAPDQYGRTYYSGQDPLGARWDLDTPHLTVTTDARRGWVGSDGSLARCSKGMSAPIITGIPPFDLSVYQPEEYYSGVWATIPGYGSKPLLHVSSNNPPPMPSDTFTYKKAATGGWRGRCTSSLARGEGEGFELLMPDGVTYRFDWLVSASAPSIMDATCPHMSLNIFPSLATSDWVGTGQCRESESIPRFRYFLYATSAKDRFGNAVTYSYDAANPRRLLKVQSSDGAAITLSYFSNGAIDKISTGGKTWSYVYANGVLTDVVLPDSSKWRYEYSSDYKRIHYTNPDATWNGCQLNLQTLRSDVSPLPDDTAWLAITHPSGARGEFRFRKLLHGTSESETGCSVVPLGYSGNAYARLSGPPSAYHIASLYKKVVTGPALPQQSWDYQYKPGWAAPLVAETRVTDSSGRVETYQFSTDRTQHYGDLLQHTIGSSTQVLMKETYSYITKGTDGYEYSLPFYGWTGNTGIRNRLLVEKVKEVNGSRFIWRVNKGCTQAGVHCIDQFNRPISVTRLSE